MKIHNFSLLSRFHLEIDDISPALQYLREFEILENEIEKNDLVQENPEVLACKAYSMSVCCEYSSVFISKANVISIYEEALRSAKLFNF